MICIWRTGRIDTKAFQNGSLIIPTLNYRQQQLACRKQSLVPVLDDDSTSCETTRSPTATDTHHSEQQQRENVSKTYCFSSTEENWAHFKGCVCAGVYSWVFSVPALHGDYCVMWITCHCWVFSVPHRASGVRFKYKHTGSTDTVGPLECHGEECGGFKRTMLPSSEHYEQISHGHILNIFTFKTQTLYTCIKNYHVT